MIRAPDHSDLFAVVGSESMSPADNRLSPATKSALESFTRGLARELGPREITVNLVRPGPIDTDMNPAHGALASSILPSLSIARYGQAREVAEAVAFLGGPGAAYVTGSGILVDGGISA